MHVCLGGAEMTFVLRSTKEEVVVERKEVGKDNVQTASTHLTFVSRLESQFLQAA